MSMLFTIIILRTRPKIFFAKVQYQNKHLISNGESSHFGVCGFLEKFTLFVALENNKRLRRAPQVLNVKALVLALM